MMDDSGLMNAARGGALQLAGRGSQPPATNGGAEARKVSRKQKRALKRQEKQAARTGSDEEELNDDGFKANFDDPRFEEVFKSHYFALDPTNPQFAKSKNKDRFVQEVARRRSKLQANGSDAALLQDGRGPQLKPGGGKDKSVADVAMDTQSLELKAMVKKLKRQQQSEAAGRAGAHKRPRK